MVIGLWSLEEKGWSLPKKIKSETIGVCFYPTDMKSFPPTPKWWATRVGQPLML